TMAFNDHTPASRLDDMLARLAGGETLALTTDAGMPAVSDPGARLVAAARGAGAAVEVLPGPSAVTAAMAISGVEATGFLFGGFLPARPASARTTVLERLLAASGATGLPLVLFEAPHRLAALLAILERLVPGARVAICRELTKLHEEVLIGSPAEVSTALPEPRGELTLVVSSIPIPLGESAPFEATALVAAATRAGLSPRTIVELLRAAGMPRRAAYRAVPSADADPLSAR
nr:SAM-dependent methyltransferase [Chloroflexota bacterium]